MIFGPSDAEFQVELKGTKKCVHQKCSKDRDSGWKTEPVSGLYNIAAFEIRIALKKRA